MPERTALTAAGKQTPAAVVHGRAASRALWAALGIIASLLSGCATTEQIAGANWNGPRENPRGREFSPKRVLQHEISGWALLRCIAGENYSVKACDVVGEFPQGEGLGEAALRMRSGMKAQEIGQLGGHPPGPGESFLFPISFCQPGDCVQVIAALDAYTQQFIAIGRLVRASRCDEAQRAAADTDQPPIIQLVANTCATPAAPNGG
jgi:hypothetical protein